MKDPMEIYSKPLKIKKYKLGVLYYMRPRTKKSGRELLVPYDERFPFISGFKTRYSYFVRFLKKGNCAGNHYHKIKKELLVPLTGEFEVRLEDIKTKKQEKLIIGPKNYVALYIIPKISHTIKSKKNNGIILVMATSSASEADEYPYKIKSKIVR